MWILRSPFLECSLTYSFINIGTDVPSLTICLSPAGLSLVKLPCVAGGANRVCKGSRFLQGVFDLHLLLSFD